MKPAQVKRYRAKMAIRYFEIHLLFYPKVFARNVFIDRVKVASINCAALFQLKSAPFFSTSFPKESIPLDLYEYG